jgi:hypothetical protein
MINLRDDLTTAMQSPSPAVRLRDSIKSLVDAGTDRDALCTELQHLRKSASEAEEDVILEVLDFLAGWCHPDMKI